MTSYIFKKRFRIALSFLMILLCFPAQAKRKDLVIMKNGDRLTGEVKKLEHGVLYVDLDYVSGSIGLDWLKVAFRVVVGFRSCLKMASEWRAQSKK